ncbi:MAG TPA: universal stress protein [Polyangiaceae bacterium]|jgi:nucleotide-binding universal stress UspA family protein|nr:universal stress protein [Polyangiaceae bacterium]
MRTILSCVDLSDASEAVVACGCDLAAPGGRLFVLHVAAPEPAFVGYGVGPGSVRDDVARDLSVRHRATQTLAEAAAARTGCPVTPLTVQGVTVDAIVEHAERLGAAFVVVASAAHGALHALLAGDVVQGVLRKATLPVVVVPHRPAPGA